MYLDLKEAIKEKILRMAIVSLVFDLLEGSNNGNCKKHVINNNVLSLNFKLWLQ